MLSRPRQVSPPARKWLCFPLAPPRAEGAVPAAQSPPLRIAQLLDAAASDEACAHPRSLACPAPDAAAVSASAYRAACPAPPLEAPCPPANGATFREPPPCPGPDACP